MPFNLSRIQGIVDRQIKRFNGVGANNAVLDRNGVTRPCTAIILNFSNRERQANPMLQWTDVRALISAKDLEIDPDNELDVLVIGGTRYRMIQPPTRLAPDGSTDLFWDLAVRK